MVFRGCSHDQFSSQGLWGFVGRKLSLKLLLLKGLLCTVPPASFWVFLAKKIVFWFGVFFPLSRM